jgi:hypothetical protein
VSNLINTLISTNSLLINSSFAEVNSQGQENINNILRVGKSNRFINIINIFFGNVYYFGNTFCFKSDLKKFILPIPSWVEAHDLYIGLTANILGKVEHFNEITIYRTIHKNNLTSKTRRSLVKIIKSRILMILIIFNGLKKSFR